MNEKERGFLLLTSQLGDPERKPLTVAQFRTLAMRAAGVAKSNDQRQLLPDDLVDLGYDRETACRVVNLLGEDRRLERYLQAGQQLGCVPISRVSETYPLAVHKRLGLDAPGCLWAKGNITLLNTQTVSLVGCREIAEDNRVFAESVGREAAYQGITLVSGNAKGADRIAQDACLKAGGNVISIVADELHKYQPSENRLYLSEDGYDLPFSAARALSRNRVIHSLGYITLIAQSDMGTGGTWDGATKNLQKGWSPLFCFDDGSPAVTELEHRGATLIALKDIFNLAALHTDFSRFL